MDIVLRGLIALLLSAASPLSAVQYAELGRALEAHRAEFGVPGVAVVLVGGDGVRWAAGFGVADLDSARPLTPDSPVRIGSITKTFTAAAILKLQEAGRLSLDDPLHRHVADPVLDNPWAQTHPVTLAQLLEHTAGLQDWTKAEFDHNDATPLTLDQGLAFLPSSRTVRWKPGLHAVYSNSGYGVAGLVIERVSGERYEAFVGRALLQPLRMRSARFFAGGDGDNALAFGYDTDGRTPIPYWHLIQRPAGALNMTPRDLAALVQLLLNNGVFDGTRVLSPESVARLESPRTSAAARSGLTFGYGLGNYAYTRNGFVFRGHGGDADGFLAHYGYCRALGTGYVIAINAANPHALRTLRREVERTLTHAQAAAPPPPPVYLERARLQRLTGRYALAAWRFPWQTAASRQSEAIDIRLSRGGYLVTETADGKRDALIPVSAQLFRRGREHVATSAFVEDEGLLYFQEEESWVKVGELESDAATRQDGAPDVTPDANALIRPPFRSQGAPGAGGVAASGVPAAGVEFDDSTRSPSTR